MIEAAHSPERSPFNTRHPMGSFRTINRHQLFIIVSHLESNYYICYMTPQKLTIVSDHWLFKCLKTLPADVLGFVEEKTEKHGDFFIVDMLLFKAFLTSKPSIFQHVLQSNHRNYIRDKAFKELGLALGNGLLVNDGESWKKQRKLAQPAFNKKRLEGMVDVMVDEGVKFCDSLEQYRNKDERVNLLSKMMEITSTIALKTLLGGALDGEHASVEENITFAQQHIISRIRKPAYKFLSYFNGKHKEFNQKIHEFDDLILNVINDRRNSADPPDSDLLSMLMSARDEDGEPMSDKQLRDEVITIFVAGHETSANSLAWTFYLLGQHPEIYKKLKEEVNQVVGDRLPVLGDLRALQYTRMVIEESMRIYPPAYLLSRECAEGDTIEGVTIPKGKPIILSIYALHRNKMLWENPLEFNPERFTPERVKERPKWHYLPFGAGPRMCIGNHFAMMEIQLLMALLVTRFDFVLDKNHEVIPEPLVTLRAKTGVMAWVK